MCSSICYALVVVDKSLLWNRLDDASMCSLTLAFPALHLYASNTWPASSKYPLCFLKKMVEQNKHYGVEDEKVRFLFWLKKPLRGSGSPNIRKKWYIIYKHFIFLFRNLSLFKISTWICNQQLFLNLKMNCNMNCCFKKFTLTHVRRVRGEIRWEGKLKERERGVWNFWA